MRKLNIILIVSLILLISLFLTFYRKSSDNVSIDCNNKDNVFDKIICFVDLAKQNNDLGKCDLSDNEGVKYQCYAIYAEYVLDSEICKKIPSKIDDGQGLIDVCISDIAKGKKDASLCEEIVTQGLKDSCYLKVYQITEDKSLCEKIIDEGLKGGCMV